MVPLVSTVSDETIVVGALANARFGDGEVAAAHRIVDRVDADEIDRQAAVERVLVGLDVAAALVDVQVDVEIAVVLQREQVVRRIDDANAAGAADVGRRDRHRTPTSRCAARRLRRRPAA